MATDYYAQLLEESPSDFYQRVGDVHSGYRKLELVQLAVVNRAICHPDPVERTRALSEIDLHLITVIGPAVYVKLLPAARDEDSRARSMFWELTGWLSDECIRTIYFLEDIAELFSREQSDELLYSQIGILRYLCCNFPVPQELHQFVFAPDHDVSVSPRALFLACGLPFEQQLEFATKITDKRFESIAPRLANLFWGSLSRKSQTFLRDDNNDAAISVLNAFALMPNVEQVNKLIQCLGNCHSNNEAFLLICWSIFSILEQSIVPRLNRDSRSATRTSYVRRCDMFLHSLDSMLNIGSDQ